MPVLFEINKAEDLLNIGLKQWAALAAIAYVVYLLSVVVYRLYFSPLAKVPGSRFCAISNAWLFHKGLTGYRMQAVHEMHRKYGNVVRVAPNLVSFLNFDVMNSVYAKLPKSDFYLGTEILEGYPHSMASRQAADHRPLRQVIAPTYSHQNVQAFEPQLAENVQLLLDRIDSNGHKGKTAVDILYLTRLVACDAIGLMGFGEDWQSTKTGYSKYIDWVDRFALVFAIKGTVGKMFARRILYNLPIAKLQNIFNVEREFIAYCLKVLDPIRAQVAANPDLAKRDGSTLAVRLLATPLSNTGKPMPYLQAGCEIFGHIFAGTDTTSVAIAYVLWHLTLNKGDLDTLRKEADETFESTGGTLPSFSTLAKLPFLNACIHEGMRLNGPAMSHLERVVDEKGLEIDGLFIPPGTVVAAQAYTVHRDSDTYENPEKYNPQRWLTTDIEKKKRMLSNMIAFGTGPRICAGSNLAWANMRLMILAILHKYDFEMAPGQHMEEMEDHFVAAPRAHKTLLYMTPRAGVKA